MIQTYYNSMCSILIMLALAIYFESSEVLAYNRYDELGFWKVLFLSSSLGVFLSTTINLNNTVNSPMTTAITGEIKNIVGTLLGFLFGDVIINRDLLIGLALSFVGAFVYTINKAKMMTKKQQ